jgi:hypothetical protein
LTIAWVMWQSALLDEKSFNLDVLLPTSPLPAPMSKSLKINAYYSTTRIALLSLSNMKGVSSNRREHAVVQTRRHVPEMQKNCSLLLHRGALRLFCCSAVARTIERRQIPSTNLTINRHHHSIAYHFFERYKK